MGESGQKSPDRSRREERRKAGLKHALAANGQNLPIFGQKKLAEI